MTTSDERFAAAIAAIDRANADDPEVLVVDGERRPKEQAHAEMMTAWVRRLAPDADEAQLLAARAHHLRRWVVPRREYPEGRKGYLQWRTQQKKRHADEVAEILVGVGYDDAVVQRVQAIVRKEGLGRDAAVQTHEDALCLVFLETQFADLIERLGDDKAIDVVAKTLAKMSPAGHAAAEGLSFTDDERRVLEAAVGSSHASKVQGSTRREDEERDDV